VRPGYLPGEDKEAGMTAPRPLGYWVSAVDQLLDEQFERSAEESGLTRREWQIINRLRIGAVEEESLQAAMAPYLDLEESLDDPLRRMMDDGLIEHQASEYRLTDRGADRVDEIQDQAVRRIRDHATDGLSQEDYEHLLASLERIARNLGWEPA
jgi:DNA-binding MarR family transcriptional regulator